MIRPNAHFAEYALFRGPLKHLDFETRAVIACINPHSYLLARTDRMFRAALLDAEILVADGTGIVQALRILKGDIIDRVTGPQVVDAALAHAAAHSEPVMFMGSSEAVLSSIRMKLAQRYPNLKVSTYSPPFKPVFSAKDNAEMCSAINRKAPIHLFIGMTAPKQEKWIHENREKICAPRIYAVGAAFDWLAGTKKMPNPIWEKLHLFWFRRFVSEPRLWRRALIDPPIFIARVVIMRLRGHL